MSLSAAPPLRGKLDPRNRLRRRKMAPAKSRSREGIDSLRGATTHRPPITVHRILRALASSRETRPSRRPRMTCGQSELTGSRGGAARRTLQRPFRVFGVFRGGPLCAISRPGSPPKPSTADDANSAEGPVSSRAYPCYPRHPWSLVSGLRPQVSGHRQPTTDLLRPLRFVAATSTRFLWKIVCQVKAPAFA
jgi:hypothetical protein